ncbi:MAG: AMP-binding protein [Pseudomonadota bacterium]|nr:AMP-binding protein [Pseudomonadota bacterium]
MTPPELVRLTLDATLRLHAERRPDHVAILDRDRRVTWAELETTVARMASGLQAHGLRPGGHVLAFPQRTWELPALFLATARAGGIYTPIDGADPARIEHVIRRGGVDLAFAPKDAEADVAARILGDPGRVIRGEAALLQLTHGAPGALPPSTDPDRPCYVNFTSGSTSMPKGAPTTHANVQWNTRAVLDVFPFTEDERFLCLFAPYSHPHEHFARTLATGGTAVMLDTLRPRTVIRTLQDHAVTWVFAIPSVFDLLLTQVVPGDTFPALRYCEAGGAVVPPELVRRVEGALGCQFIPIWGCTETTGVVLHVPPWEPERRLEMLGKPVAHYEVKVIDTDEATGVGELCVRGGAVVAGYPERPDATAEKFKDGWYHTGDLVREEDNGYLRFLGRREEMIKVGGVKVYLLDIERTIAAIPGVKQVVVVPARDPLRGEVPRAVIVPLPGAALSREDILSHCRKALPASMVPRIVEFRDELPAFPSGKLNKRAIVEQVPVPVAMAVNSMLIADRPIDEVFRLARAAADRAGFPVLVDLRSRRAAASDPDRAWAVAHTNADFDIGDPASVDRAVALSWEHGVPIAMTSAYMGACVPGDREYGRHVIEQAYHLAEAAPDRTLILRVLGGDLYARARSLPGRWQDIRKQLRDESLATIQYWEGCTRELSARTGKKVVLGLEIHHGQYLSDLHDVHHCCRGLRATGWDLVGFIDDPANRFIASEGDLLGAMDFARMVRAWGGRVVAYHLKDVRYLSPWNQFHPQPMQRVGERIFVWGTNKYEWVGLGAGEVDLSQTLMAASTLAQPPHAFCLVSTEYVAASTDEADATRIVEDYRALVRDGRV